MPDACKNLTKNDGANTGQSVWRDLRDRLSVSLHFSNWGEPLKLNIG
jgi:hypothetical protein